MNGAVSPRGPHYVLVTGQNDTDWNIADPGWINAVPSAALDSLDAHYTGFTTFSLSDPNNAIFHQFTVSEARAYAGPSTGLATPNLSSLIVTALSPIELVISNAGGERLGYNPVTQAYFDEIPKGNYYRDFPTASDDIAGPAPGDPTGVKTIYIGNPTAGSFNIEAFGTAQGGYTLEFRAIATDGSVKSISLSGVAVPGSTSSFQVSYDPTPNSSFTAARMATFQSTLADTANSLQSRLITRPATARVLSRMIQLASDAASRGQTQISKQRLTAFKRLVTAFAHRSIQDSAVQVLLQDADSLLAQL